MEIIDDKEKTLKESLSAELKPGSELAIAAACFSIYAYQALKDELQSIESLRFIFTSPTFTAEKAPRERREFYIPRLNRERSLYGSEFEVRLRNELTQKAVARECAEWIKKKATFCSNVGESQFPYGMITVGDTAYMPVNSFTTVDPLRTRLRMWPGYSLSWRMRTVTKRVWWCGRISIRERRCLPICGGRLLTDRLLRSEVLSPEPGSDVRLRLFYDVQRRMM